MLISQIHFDFFTVTIRNIFSKGMEDVFNAGLAKAIGLSNVNTKQIDRIYNAASVKPHNVQVSHICAIIN